MIDLTQQWIAEYEQYLIDLLEKLKVPEPPYSQALLFKNRTNMKMWSLLGSDENNINNFDLQSRLEQLTEQYRRKLS